MNEFESDGDLAEEDLRQMIVPGSRNPYPRIGAQIRAGHSGLRVNTKHSRYRQRQCADMRCPTADGNAPPFTNALIVG